MAFDLGFDFRATAGYVTDPSYGVPVLGEAYPHTYTNVYGYSVNAGWTSGPAGTINRNNTVDVRLVGSNYENGSGVTDPFQVDLSSGSAPGAGTYGVDAAVGDPNFASNAAFDVKDNATVLIDGTNGGAGTSVGATHYLDATVTDVDMTGGGVWAGTPVNKTFATTTAIFDLIRVAGGNTAFAAHFRLTLQEAPATFALDDTGLAITPSPTRRVVPVW